MSWPNRITVLRLLLVPVFVLLVLSAADAAMYRYAALALVVVIGICDAADGIIARRTGRVTKIGSLLDPLADKALMISALVILSKEGVLSPEHPNLYLPYLVSVPLVSRDLLILVGAAVVFFLAGVFHALPSASGKAATVLQFILITAMLASPDFVRWFPEATWYALYAIWIATIVLGLVSLLGYIRTGSKLLSAGGH
ncbi:MAG: CDP-alcohol phosphatidyltransferase family protein [Phycisphaerae bacterium]|nr:CDP-alcohol phosphatidyltransferase family protein [Phycisphaerae bacterium]